MKCAFLVMAILTAPLPVPPPPVGADDSAEGGVVTATADGLTAEQVERRRKCRLLWSTHAPWSYSPDLADYLCSEHERRGIGPEWYFSLIYGMANFGLRVGATAPGRCYGPMDVKWPYCARSDAERLLAGRAWHQGILRDPYVNIACHTGEMARLHERTGRTGMALIRSVFYPAAPYGRACNRWASRWERVEREFGMTLASPGGAHGTATPSVPEGVTATTTATATAQEGER